MRSQAEIMCHQTALGGSRERLPMKLSPCVQKGAWHSVPRRTYLLERLGTASQPPQEELPPSQLGSGWHKVLGEPGELPCRWHRLEPRCFQHPNSV